METIFLNSLLLAIITAIAIIISIALHDFRTTRAKNKSIQRKRRQHPRIAVEVEENVSDACLASIKQSDYHNYEIIFFGEHTKSRFILSIHNNALLDPTAIRYNISILADFPKWDYIAIKPVLPKPQKISELFHLYHTVALAPFIPLRSAFKILPTPHQPWPILRRSTMPVRRLRSRLYRFICWLVLVINTVLISYITIVALATDEPLYLFIYLLVLLVWLVVCIVEYPHFSRNQKVIYTLLSPVSFWFFFAYALYAPLIPIVRAIVNKIASIFWRAHRQTIA